MPVNEPFITKIESELDKIQVMLSKHESVIDSIIEERTARKAFWESVRTHLVSNGIWGVLAALAYVLWYATQTYISAKHG